ncbi:MAG TPA: NifU family protein [Actinomycetes bacterium]
MAEVRNLREVGSRIERLLAELGADADPSVRRRAEELVRLLVDFYGAALARVVELADQSLLERLADDELVASLLIVHDLHPLPTLARVEAALERVRPYLGTHAGGVVLHGIDEQGVVHLALEGTCNGCQSSTLTVKLSIERAIEEAAPEVTGVDVEGIAAEPQPAGRLLQIQPYRHEAPGPCPVPEPAGEARA